MKIWVAVIAFAMLLNRPALAQSGASQSSKQAAPAAATDSDEEPDVPVVKPANAASATVEQQTTTAWDMLRTAVFATKTQVEQVRIDAINVLGTLGDFPEAAGWLRGAQKDQDRYVRLAAVTAMGSSKKAAFVPDLKQALRDEAPEVSFAAAIGLWKMNDKSGEDVLDAVLAGDRKASRGLMTAEKHEADQDLHSPSKLASIGAEQGAFALLGPFGYGLSAWRSTRRHNGIQPKVIAATLLAQDTSTELMEKFVDALDDTDPSVRTAAAKALGDYHGKEVTDALGGEFYDSKPTVRFMAAASYIRATRPEPEKRDVHRRKTASASLAHSHSTTAAP
jgi:HEAT repeat protein